MSPVPLQNGEVQYYASPVLVKNNRYNATLTNQRLILEGNNNREFRVANIVAAYPEMINGTEPGVKLIIATPTGQKEMIWSFPLDNIFKKGEQDAWITAIQKTAGDNPFTEENNRAPITAVAQTSTVQAANGNKSEENAVLNLIRGENVIISTSGVQIKHSFYTAYLTNLRFILVNNNGTIGREFAIAELKDAAELESETGNAEIALSVGMQSGLKQMILTFPTRNARDAWMQKLQTKLPREQPQKMENANIAQRIGTFTPATNERILISTPNVKIKNRPMILHLTNTRLIIDSANGIMGEFAIGTLTRAIRISGDLGDPGISLSINSAGGKKDMHMLFLSMNEREAWMDQLHTLIPDTPAPVTAPKYTVTQVEPRNQFSAKTLPCPKCGSMNSSTDEVCGMCGTELHAPAYHAPAKKEREPREPRAPREPRIHSEYNGNIFGFIFHPKDAFNYYAHEGPKMAIIFCLLSGLIWAAITSIFLAFILPNIIQIDKTTFPIFAEMQGNAAMFILLLLIFWGLWFVGILVHALIAGIIGSISSKEARFGECMTIVMRSSMAYGICGWIPVIGLVAAGIWTAICSMFGMRETQGMSPASAGVAAFLGLIIVYVIIVIIGVI